MSKRRQSQMSTNPLAITPQFKAVAKEQRFQISKGEICLDLEFLMHLIVIKHHDRIKIFANIEDLKYVLFQCPFLRKEGTKN